MSDALATGEAELWVSSGDTKQVGRKFSLSKDTCESSQGVRVVGVSDALATGEAELWVSSGDTKQVRTKFSLYKDTCD